MKENRFSILLIECLLQTVANTKAREEGIPGSWVGAIAQKDKNHLVIGINPSTGSRETGMAVNRGRHPLSTRAMRYVSHIRFVEAQSTTADFGGGRGEKAAGRLT